MTATTWMYLAASAAGAVGWGRGRLSSPAPSTLKRMSSGMTTPSWARACSQPSTRPATLLSPVLHTGNM